MFKKHLLSMTSFPTISTSFNMDSMLKHKLRYADWLVTTFNTALLYETWRTPDPHPCSVKLADVQQSSENDYQSLVNCVQRHTRCNAAYCLRRKNAQQEPSCRFGYPMECTSQSCITFERISTGEVRAKLTTARNDPRVNSHNRTMLQHWRANIDIQVIIDVTACAHYLAKYVSKSEPRSKAASEVFSNCVHNLPSTSSSSTIFRKCLIQSVGERHYSAQETAH